MLASGSPTAPFLAAAIVWFDAPVCLDQQEFSGACAMPKEAVPQFTEKRVIIVKVIH